MKNKKCIIVISIILLIVIIGFGFLWYISGGFLGEILFNRPNKPKIKNGEFPFELVYEYNGEEFKINETIICKYEGISFSLEGGNSRNWNCYITNNNDFGQYYLDKEKYPSLYIQVPLNAEYYMGAPDANLEFAKPYIFFVDELTGTTYYEQDLMDLLGVKIVSWNPSNPLENNIK